MHRSSTTCSLSKDYTSSSTVPSSMLGRSSSFRGRKDCVELPQRSSLLKRTSSLRFRNKSVGLSKAVEVYDGVSTTAEKMKVPPRPRIKVEELEMFKSLRDKSSPLSLESPLRQSFRRSKSSSNLTRRSEVENHARKGEGRPTTKRRGRSRRFKDSPSVADLYARSNVLTHEQEYAPVLGDNRRASSSPSYNEDADSARRTLDDFLSQVEIMSLEDDEDDTDDMCNMFSVFHWSQNEFSPDFCVPSPAEKDSRSRKIESPQSVMNLNWFEQLEKEEEQTPQRRRSHRKNESSRVGEEEKQRRTSSTSRPWSSSCKSRS